MPIQTKSTIHCAICTEVQTVLNITDNSLEELNEKWHTALRIKQDGSVEWRNLGQVKIVWGDKIVHNPTDSLIVCTSCKSRLEEAIKQLITS